MASRAKHDWPMVRLGDVCHLKYGKALKKEERVAGEFPVFGSAGSVGSHVEANFVGPVSVVGRKGSAGFVEWSSGNCWIIDTAFGVFPKSEEQVDSRWLYWLLKDLRLGRLQKHAAVPGISKADVVEEKFLLPPLDEQRRIAAILDEVRDSLHALQQQIQVLLRLPSLLLGELFKFSEKRRLDEIAMVGTGATPSRKNVAFYQGDIPWVKTTEVKGTIITETEEKISVGALESSTCKLNRAGSSVVAMYGQGATRGRAGYLGIEAATNQACAVVTPIDPIDDYFVYQCLLNSYEEIRGLGRGGTQPNLNLSLVRSFQIPYPSAELRGKISKDLCSIENVVRKLRRRRDLLNELLESLSTRAFQGEL